MIVRMKGQILVPMTHRHFRQNVFSKKILFFSTNIISIPKLEVIYGFGLVQSLFKLVILVEPCICKCLYII